MANRRGDSLSEQELIAINKQIHVDRHAEASANAGGEGPWKEDGWVLVKDQAIMIKDQEAGGLQPVIRPVWPVRLFVNGREVNGETSVSAADRCEWRMADNPLFEIRVSEDNMAVHLLVHAKERHAWRLLDGGPAAHLELAAEEDRSVVLETLHVVEIIERIEKLGIKAKLDLAAIVKEVENPSGKEIMIAEGKRAVPGKDAWLELYFPEQITHQFYEVDGVVDFRNHYQIPSVRKGQLIARKWPMVPGQSGYDVFGNSIAPDPPKDLMVVTRPSVQMLENGEIYALRDGRPRLSGTRVKILDIATAHIEYGNVDFETGNIVFSGDVIIYGNVCDHMIVESLGNVTGRGVPGIESGSGPAHHCENRGRRNGHPRHAEGRRAHHRQKNAVWKNQRWTLFAPH